MLRFTETDGRQMKFGEMMKSIFIGSKNILGFLFCIFLMMLTQAFAEKTPIVLDQNANLPKRNASSIKNREISVNFNNVDIQVFIKFISELTGKNFVVDQRVRGKVTIISPGRISVKEAFKVFESVLEVHGYTSIRAGEIYKIVPSPDARTKSIETKLKEEAVAPEDKIVTQLISLRYADPVEVKRLFAPLISKSSAILAYPATNILIVTDVYSNIKRLLKILKVIDIPGIGREISVIPLYFADATKLVKLIDTFFKAPRKPPKTTARREVKLFAEDRTNTVIVLASENDTLKIKKLIKLLDKETPRKKEKIHVYYLENANAEELAKVLQGLQTKESDSEKGRPLKRRRAPEISDRIIITPDKATNSLIIRADKDTYLVLEEIIKKLDIPRSMVYIESLIMEVNIDKEFEIGTEWSAFAGDLNDDGTFTGIGGGSGGGGFNKIPAIDPETGLPVGPFPTGFSLGIFQTLKIGDLIFPNLAAMINVLKKDKDVTIISTPQILTMDNEEASIIVGATRPFQTSTTVTDDSELQNFEYRDVGVTLKITPHITKDRMVRLKIFHEIQKLDELASTDVITPTTLKRSIDTTVIVKDKSTVVIGGLIDDAIANVEHKIPCLGDIPLAGWLFKSLSEGREQTNLFVFLTPHVITSPEEADELYNKKKDRAPVIEGGEIKLYKQETQ